MVKCIVASSNLWKIGSAYSRRREREVAARSDLWLLFQGHVCAMQYRQAQECGMLLGDGEGSMSFCLELRSVVVLICDASPGAL